MMRLSVHDLQFSYAEGRPLFALPSWSWTAGERLALIGPSGCGKSTFCRLLAGQLAPTEGRILVDGMALPPLTSGQPQPVQLIYQHPELAVNPLWRMERVLQEGGFNADLPAHWALLKALQIERAWLRRFPLELSGGEIQRLCLARALLSPAPFLIADEITTMLDSIRQAQLWHILLEAVEAKGAGLLVVTHNLALAKRLCPPDGILTFESLMQSSEGA